MPKQNQFDIDQNDGTFLIGYNDWIDNFGIFYLYYDFDDNWNGVRFSSSWTEDTSRLPNENYKSGIIYKSPQYVIYPSNDMELILSLS